MLKHIFSRQVRSFRPAPFPYFSLHDMVSVNGKFVMASLKKRDYVTFEFGLDPPATTVDERRADRGAGREPRRYQRGQRTAKEDRSGPYRDREARGMSIKRVRINWKERKINREKYKILHYKIQI